MKLLTLKIGSALFASSLLVAGASQAADFPNRALNLVVPFAAGGPTDIVARSLAEAMRPTLGQPVIVENKGGAGGTIGTSQVARAKPDGYSFLLMNIGFSTAPSLYKDPGYKPDSSFEPIGMVVEAPMVIYARSDFPPNNVQELVKYLKANKENVSIAHGGFGAGSHLCVVMFANAVDVDLLTIPYKGTGPAMNDLLGKQVDLMCDQTTNTLQQIRSGTVKAYAVTSKQRLPTLPDLPTMQEAGFQDFEVAAWHGLWVPKGTSKPVVDKLKTALQAGLADPDFQKRMAGLDANVLTSEANPEALRKRVAQEVPKWADLFKKVGMQPQ